MRVRCFMRSERARHGLSLDEVSARTRIAKGELSMFERGHSVPRDDQAERLRPIYGPPASWYPAGVLHVLMPDLGDCLGCGEELDPDGRRNQAYHGAACRAEARRNGRAL